MIILKYLDYGKIPVHKHILKSELLPQMPAVKMQNYKQDSIYNSSKVKILRYVESFYEETYKMIRKEIRKVSIIVKICVA